MAEVFRFHHTGPRLEFYTETYDFGEQHVENIPGIQPPGEHNFIPISRSDTLILAPDDPDIRGYAVNSPNGHTLGIVVGFLADAANSLVPYAYVQVEDGRTVIIPTNQFMIFQNLKLVTLEGGKEALRYAPDATWCADDALRADHYWSEYRRENAA